MISIKVDTRGATAKFSAVLAEIRRSEESVVRQQARGLAVAMIRVTQPFGLGATDGEAFQAAIAADISRVYLSPSDIWDEVARIDPNLAKAKWAEYKRGDWNKLRQLIEASGSPQLQRLLIQARIDPSLHRRARNRTRKRSVPKKYPGAQLVTNPRNSQRYIAAKQRRAGRAASGWATAAKGLGGSLRGVPTWKAYGRHKAEGRGTVKTTRRGVTAELRNSVPWIDKAIQRRAKEKAERIAYEKFLKAIEISKRKAIQKANRTARRNARAA